MKIKDGGNTRFNKNRSCIEIGWSGEGTLKFGKFNKNRSCIGL